MNSNLEKPSFNIMTIAGLSADDKPLNPEGFGSYQISNGSQFIEMDTGKVFMYDEENREWLEV